MVENKSESEPFSLKETLNSRWDNLCQKIDIPTDNKTFNTLTSYYSEPHRHYHTLNHINNCFQEFDEVKTLLQDPNTVELAIWFHDAIYNIGQKDNEEKSSQLAINFCQKNNLSSIFTNKVSNLISSTKHISPSNELGSQYLNDIDMAILGQTTNKFNLFDQNIKKEFTSFYPIDIYLKGRILFFDSLLKKKEIFSTDYFKNKYEIKTKQNIEKKETELKQQLLTLI